VTLVPLLVLVFLLWRLVRILRRKAKRWTPKGRTPQDTDSGRESVVLVDAETLEKANAMYSADTISDYGEKSRCAAFLSARADVGLPVRLRHSGASSRGFVSFGVEKAAFGLG